MNQNRPQQFVDRLSRSTASLKLNPDDVIVGGYLAKSRNKPKLNPEAPNWLSDVFIHQITMPDQVVDHVTDHVIDHLISRSQGVTRLRS